ncbi:MAG: GDSL-type esterase/lipase family protein [bacterium]|nr:GDSL-type esterase/lipase family protein [bacterium]
MRKFTKVNIIIFFIVLSSIVYAEKFIPATDSRLQYIGRVISENSIVHLTWPGSELHARFTGTTLQLVLAESTRNSLWVKIDNQDWQAFNVLSDQTVINLTPIKLSRGTHTFRVVKKTESSWGRLSIKGILLDDTAKLLHPPKRKKYRIECIGDSITSGFAVHGKWSAINDDALATYGFQAAEASGAEVWLTAQSGIGIIRNYKATAEVGTMPLRYRNLELYNDAVKVDFTKWQPHIITINLGTNDNSVSADTATLETRFFEFLTELRTLHPSSWILVLRPFHGYYAESEKKVVEQRKQAGDKKIAFIDTTGWLDRKTDYTDGTHPNPIGHRKAAEKLIPILKYYLHRREH